MALPKPPKEYYTLEEVAQDWDWTVAELWAYAEQEKLQICVLLKNIGARIIEFELDINNDVIEKIPTFDSVQLNGVYPFHPIQLYGFPYNDDYGVALDSLYQDFEILKTRHSSISLPPPHTHKHVLYGYEFYETRYNPQLVITHKEKIRFEEEHGHERPAKKPPYLNSDHPCFSTELCDAVRAWLRTAKQNPEPQKFKAIAKEWLENAGYEGQALDRLATVVNPDKGKKGGAPKKE